MGKEDFKNDTDSELHLSTLSGLGPKQPPVENINDLRVFLSKKLDENDQVNKDQHKKLKSHERALFGYETDTRERVKGIIDRVKELEERAKSLEDYKDKAEKFRERVYWIVGALTTTVTFLLPFAWSLVKLLLAKVGIKM